MHATSPGAKLKPLAKAKREIIDLQKEIPKGSGEVRVIYDD